MKEPDICITAPHVIAGLHFNHSIPLVSLAPDHRRWNGAPNRRQGRMTNGVTSGLIIHLGSELPLIYGGRRTKLTTAANAV